MSAVVTPRAPATAACPECGQTVGIYNSMRVNSMRQIPQRYTLHDANGQKCEGSYSRVENEKPASYDE